MTYTVLSDVELAKHYGEMVRAEGEMLGGYVPSDVLSICLTRMEKEGHTLVSVLGNQRNHTFFFHKSDSNPARLLA